MSLLERSRPKNGEGGGLYRGKYPYWLIWEYIPGDEYNRITLMTSPEILLDPNNSILQSGTDSGVVKMFEILYIQIAVGKNESHDVDNTMNSRGRNTNSISDYDCSFDPANANIYTCWTS